MHFIALLALTLSSQPTQPANLCDFLGEQRGTLTDTTALAILDTCSEQAKIDALGSPRLAVTFRVDGSADLVVNAGRGLWYNPNHPRRTAYVQVEYKEVELPPEVEELLPFVDPFAPKASL